MILLVLALGGWCVALNSNLQADQLIIFLKQQIYSSSRGWKQHLQLAEQTKEYQKFTPITKINPKIMMPRYSLGWQGQTQLNTPASQPTDPHSQGGRPKKPPQTDDRGAAPAVEHLQNPPATTRSANSIKPTAGTACTPTAELKWRLAAPKTCTAEGITEKQYAKKQRSSQQAITRTPLPLVEHTSRNV